MIPMIGRLSGSIPGYGPVNRLVTCPIMGRMSQLTSTRLRLSVSVHGLLIVTQPGHHVTETPEWNIVIA